MNLNISRLLSLSTNPAGLLAAAGAIYAATVMITNAYHHHGIIDPEVIVAAIGAVGALFARQLVTPVADPKDPNGNPLVPVPPVAATAPQPVLPPQA